MSVKTKKPRAGAAVEDLPFEAALAELEALVAQLEDGELPLEEALTVFERGQALAARCGRLLEAAELKVQMVMPRGEAGAQVEPFAAED